MRLRTFAVVAVLTASVAAQSAQDAVVKRVTDDPKFKSMLSALDRDHDRLVSEIVKLTEIAAPPFKEDQRAAAYLEMLRETGLTNVERDAEGNVMGVRRGKGNGAAHRDCGAPRHRVS